MTMHMGATGYFVTKAIEKRWKKRKDPQICECSRGGSCRFPGQRMLDVYMRTIGKGSPPARQTVASPHQSTLLPANCKRISTASSSRSLAAAPAPAPAATTRSSPAKQAQRKLAKQQRKAGNERSGRRSGKAEKKERKHDRKMEKDSSGSSAGAEEAWRFARPRSSHACGWGRRGGGDTYLVVRATLTREQHQESELTLPLSCGEPSHRCLSRQCTGLIASLEIQSSVKATVIACGLSKRTQCDQVPVHTHALRVEDLDRVGRPALKPVNLTLYPLATSLPNHTPTAGN